MLVDIVNLDNKFTILSFPQCQNIILAHSNQLQTFCYFQHSISVAHLYN